MRPISSTELRHEAVALGLIPTFGADLSAEVQAQAAQVIITRESGVDAEPPAQPPPTRTERLLADLVAAVRDLAAAVREQL